MEHTPAVEGTSPGHAHPKIDYVRIFIWLTGFTIVELLV